MEGKSKKFALNQREHEAEEGNKGSIFSIPSKITEEAMDLICVLGQTLTN